mmetsp:Transcript_905/g.1906  ORF Transcript_905/g.1906 Transcript_905/m.1906 type:complete len:261 (+) Transcript_905:965-1747(+)
MRVPFGGVRRFVPFAAGICVPMPSSRFRVVVVVAVVVVVVVVVHPSSRRRPFHPRHVPEMREIGIDEVACAPRATCEGRLRIPRGGIGAIPRDVRIAVEAGRFRRRRRKTTTTIRRRGEERRSRRERLNRRRRRRGASRSWLPRPFLGVFEWSRSRDSVNDEDDDEEDDEEEEETKVEKEREEARSRSRSLSNGGRGRDEKGTTNWPRRRWGGDGRRRSRARWTHWRIIFVWTRGGGFRLSPYLQGFLGGMDGEDGCTWE